MNALYIPQRSQTGDAPASLTLAVSPQFAANAALLLVEQSHHAEEALRAHINEGQHEQDSQDGQNGQFGQDRQEDTLFLRNTIDEARGNMPQSLAPALDTLLHGSAQAYLFASKRATAKQKQQRVQQALHARITALQQDMQALALFWTPPQNTDNDTTQNTCHELLQERINQVRRTVRSLEKAAGKSGTDIARQEAAHMAKIHKNMVQYFLQQNAPQNAASWLAAHQKEMTADDSKAYKEQIQQKEAFLAAQKKAASLLQNGKKSLHNGENTSGNDLTRRMLREFFAEQEKQKREAEEQRIEQAWTTLFAAQNALERRKVLEEFRHEINTEKSNTQNTDKGNADNAPKGTAGTEQKYAETRHIALHAMEKTAQGLAEGKTPQSDMRRYYALMLTMDSQTPLWQERGSFSEHDFAALLRVREELKNGESDSQNALRNALLWAPATENSNGNSNAFSPTTLQKLRIFEQCLQNGMLPKPLEQLRLARDLFG